ncbi:unnamed protein product, partial [Brenthis ino]
MSYVGRLWILARTRRDFGCAGWTRAGLHPNAMIHIIRFAGELNVFHYCHSSEEVGGEGRRGCGGGPRALRRHSVARRHSRCQYARAAMQVAYA